MLGQGGGADAGDGPEPGWPEDCDTGGAAPDFLSGGSAGGPSEHDPPSEPARELSREQQRGEGGRLLASPDGRGFSPGLISQGVPGVPWDPFAPP